MIDQNCTRVFRLVGAVLLHEWQKAERPVEPVGHAAGLVDHF